MIPSGYWMAFSIDCLQAGTRYKRWNESYNYDHVNWSEDFDRGDPEALAVYEQYKVWRVTRRLKS